MRSKKDQGKRDRGISKRIPEVTLSQIEAMGENFVGRRVRFANCEFGGIDNYNNLYIRVDVSDSTAIFCNCLVPKQRMGKFVASIKQGSILNVEGDIMPRDEGDYVMLVDKIEIVRGERKKLQW
jgi:hypothetical protein